MDGLPSFCSLENSCKSRRNSILSLYWCGPRFDSSVRVIQMRDFASILILISIVPISHLRAQTALDERRIESAVVGIESSVHNSKRSGSGIVISRSGLLLTSDALVPSDSRSVAVSFCNGRHVTATVVANDRATEACLLQ